VAGHLPHRFTAEAVGTLSQSVGETEGKEIKQRANRSADALKHEAHRPHTEALGSSAQMRQSKELLPEPTDTPQAYYRQFIWKLNQVCAAVDL